MLFSCGPYFGEVDYKIGLEDRKALDSLTQQTIVLDKAIFLISLDTELGWGSFDRRGVEKYGSYYAEARNAISTLLGLFEQHSIKATWAMVGHLFLTSCSRNGPDNHNHVLQPQYHWHPDGWLSHDPFSNVEEAPFFYGPDIVDRIRASSIPHEIGSHTFTHAILGDPECSREVAYSQLLACKRLASAKGFDHVSVVFPRNSVGHLDALHELGFTSFRGIERNWYQAIGSKGTLRRMCHFVDRWVAIQPPAYEELSYYRTQNGTNRLFELPASMFYVPYQGIWRLVSPSRRVRQALRGIRCAVERKALFHLWFHPFNMATSPHLLDGLNQVLEAVRQEIDAGNLTNLTMGETAEYANSRADAME